jgi:hypothetical protein
LLRKFRNSLVIDEAIFFFAQKQFEKYKQNIKEVSLFLRKQIKSQ